MRKNHLSDHEIDSLLLPEQSVELILSAQHIVSDIKRNQNSIYNSASGIQIAAQLLDKSHAAGIALHYHEVVADIAMLGWKNADIRHVVCNSLSPGTIGNGHDDVLRLNNLAADNAKSMLDIFINRRFYELQRASNLYFQKLGIAC